MRAIHGQRKHYFKVTVFRKIALALRRHFPKLLRRERGDIQTLKFTALLRPFYVCVHVVKRGQLHFLPVLLPIGQQPVKALMLDERIQQDRDCRDFIQPLFHVCQSPLVKDPVEHSPAQKHRGDPQRKRDGRHPDEQGFLFHRHLHGIIPILFSRLSFVMSRYAAHSYWHIYSPWYMDSARRSWARAR